MTAIDIAPTFTTAQARGGEWIDEARFWGALARYGDAFASHGGPGGGGSGARRILEMGRARIGIVQRTQDVAVAMPNLARLTSRGNGIGQNRQDLLQIVNGTEHLQCLLEGDQILTAHTQPNSYPDRNDLGGFCDGNYPAEALALLQPACFLHGWTAVREPQPIDHAGRQADEVRMERVVPFSDPRMCGDHFNPNIFEYVETAEFVIDREQGIVLEWRAMLDGAVYERHWFSSVAFDVPLDDALFNRSAVPTEVTIER